MDAGWPGLGTALNVVTVLVGGAVGMAAGHRLPERTRSVVTDCLGLVTLLMAALSAMAVTDASFVDAVGGSATVLVVLGSLLLGGIAGSMLRIDERLESVAGRLQRRLAGGSAARADDAVGVGPAGEDGSVGRSAPSARERFVEGWLTATLLFCVGPLTILGSLDDGLGRGVDRLAVKSVLDGFAAMAFASTFGVGVLLSAGSVVVVQGALTLAGMLLGDLMPPGQIAALTATGGLLLTGVAFRLLRIRDIPVGDLLPALVVAPLLTALVGVLR